MAQQNNTQPTTLQVEKTVAADAAVVSRAVAMLGDEKSYARFRNTAIQLVSSGTQLAYLDANSIVGAMLSAISCNLPLTPGLGRAAIVPYGRKAQFLIMARGLVTLAIRSGLYETANVRPVYKDGMKVTDEILGTYEIIPTESREVVGYIAAFKMKNGFYKQLYMTVEECREHGKRYSKSFEHGVWSSNFEAMCEKTVIKKLLLKWGELSVEMENALRYDQSTVKGDVTKMDIGEMDVEYSDNPESGAARRETFREILDDAEDVQPMPETADD